jgi:hypothetical protein
MVQVGLARKQDSISKITYNDSHPYNHLMQIKIFNNSQREKGWW